MALDTRKRYMLADPTTRPIAASFTGAQRLNDLRGKRVGLIDDSKPNGKEILEELADLLKAQVRRCRRHVPPQALRLQARRPRSCSPNGQGV